MRGALNCGAALSGVFVRVNPVGKKLVQFSVVCFAAQDSNTALGKLATQRAETETYHLWSPSVRSTCNFFSLNSWPMKAITLSSPYLSFVTLQNRIFSATAGFPRPRIVGVAMSECRYRVR